MNKLEQLIRELCPGGIRYGKLCDVLVIRNGRDYKRLGSGPFPVYGSGGIMTYVDHYVYDKPSVLIPRKGSIDKLYYVDEPFWNVDTIFYTEIDTSQVVPKYIYFLLQMKHLEQYNIAGGVPSLTQKVLNDIEISIPPLLVQREIVRILDNFTDITAKLTTELTMELAARKMQYEYYRDKLLTFDVHGGGIYDCQWRTFGEVCYLKAGKSIPTHEISSAKTSVYSVPCFGGNGLCGYVEQANQQGEKSLISCQGALCGNIWYVTGDYYATEHAVVVTDKGFFNSRFLYHVLVHENLNQYKNTGAQPELLVAKLETILIFVPSLAIQDRIAYVFDNFDSICTELNIGLPAEIDARKKLYEFYRDSLLTFAKTGIIIRQNDRQIIIKLIQYVFEFVPVVLSDVAYYPKERIDAGTVDELYYVGVDNLLQNRQGKVAANYVPKEGRIPAYKHGDVLIGNIRPYLRKIWFADSSGGTNGDVLVIRIYNDTVVYPKYLFYVLSDERFFEYNNGKAKGAKMPRGDRQVVMDYQFLIPTLVEQKRIVSILDHFDILCNDLTSGLPAEIEARQKQYEYYRDKLLTFKPAE